MIDSRCGLPCTGCSWKESHGCGGCVETNGQPFHGECHIAVCCQEKGYAHCGECPDIPCEKLYEYSYLDPEHGDKPQGRRVEQCRSWAAEGGIHRWGNVLLTDSGWTGSFDGGDADNILRRFWGMLGKPPREARLLFIPTAANSAESRPAAGKCFAEVLAAGISPNNIRLYDVDGTLTLEQAMKYDAVYVTGGDTGYLLSRVRATGFDGIVKRMICANKVYVGVSAGSLIAAPNIGGAYDKETAGLCLIHAYLSVHQREDAPARGDLPLPHIPLSGGQALAVNWRGYTLMKS